MANAQPFPKFITDDLAALRGRIDSFGAPPDLVPASSMETTAGTASMKKSLVILLSAVFVAGMLLGWLVIGWWLWPVQWTSPDSAQTPADYQRMLVTWAANRYWQTGDAVTVQKAFATWKRDDLATLLVTMEHETNDAEARRRLVALGAALQLPVSQSSLMLFFSQPAIWLSILLTLAPLLAGLGFVTLPRLRKKSETLEEIVDETAPPEESLDALLAEVEVGEQTEAAQGQAQKEEEKKEEKPAEEEQSENAGLGDLASLFEEEDTSINVLEAFCKGMPEISVDELLTMGIDLVHRLRQSNAAS